MGRRQIVLYKYISGIFYVVIIVTVCNRINTDAASLPNTEVRFIGMKQSRQRLFQVAKYKYALFKYLPDCRKPFCFRVRRVNYKNTNERSTVFTTNIEQESIQTIQPIFLTERISRIGPDTISKQVPRILGTSLNPGEPEMMSKKDSGDISKS